MKLFLFIFCCLAITRSLFAQGVSPLQRIEGQISRDNAESLIDGVELDQQFSDAVPGVVSKGRVAFQAIINYKTDLEDLDKLRRKVARRLGITISYRMLQFRNDSLLAIAIEVKKDGKQSRLVGTLSLRDSADFGIFEISYKNQMYWFIGHKSYYMHTL